MKTTQIVIDGYELAPTQFYLKQMKRTIDMFDRGDNTADLGLPILSFFSGIEQKQPFAEIFTGHIYIFSEDKTMQREIEFAPLLYIRWVETIFFYFREMAAFPQLASDIWMCCWLTLKMFERNNPTLAAQSQLACWAAVYEPSFAVIVREHIKEMKLVSKKDKVARSLFLSTTINQDQDDFNWHVKNAFELSMELAPIHKLQAYINYYLIMSLAQ